jgi:pantoate--beta-alanine ligase
MGALHAGHVRLMETARGECDVVVVTIFVNPTQFGPNEDFSRYPRTFADDVALCEQSGVDFIFAPDIAEMYPPDFRTFVTVEGWDQVLCGASRPGHFRGVCTVVLKLFHAIPADVAYFGQKDAQQWLIIQRLVRDLNLPIVIRSVETVREADGLALSSRNRYLSPTERAKAPVLYQALQAAKQAIQAGERDPSRVEQMIRDTIASVPEMRLDYASVVSIDTLARPDRLTGTVLVALAAFLGTTRLIDNVILEVPN